MKTDGGMSLKIMMPLLSVTLVCIYWFPLFTLTSLYAAGHMPYLLFVLLMLIGWLSQWIQNKITNLPEKSPFIRGGIACATGLIIVLILEYILTLSLPDRITLGVAVVISVYAGLTFEPAFHSARLWRLKLTGVISAIVFMIAANQIEFMQQIQLYTAPVYVAGVISFVSWMIGLYMVQLDQAIMNDGKRKLVLREFAKANHQRMMWMLIVIAVIGAFPSLASWLAPMRDRLLTWIRGLFGRTNDKESLTSSTPPHEPMTFPDEMKGMPSEPSIFWDIIGWVVMGVAATVIFWLLIRWGQKVIYQLLDRFKGMLQPVHKKAESQTEYVDISESLEAPVKVRKRWFRRKESPPDQDMDRVRFYYRHWVSRATEQGVIIDQAHTPLEAAHVIAQSRSKQDSEELLMKLPDIYNEVRYGEKLPRGSDMAEIDRIWKSYRK